MAKAKFNKNKLKLIGVIFALVAAGTITYMNYQALLNSRKLIVIPKTKEAIVKGEMITKDKIAYAEQSRIGLDENLIIKEEDILGKYALRDYGVNENFFASSITDNYLRSIQEKARYGGMAVSVNSLQTANGEIKENDFVKIIIISPNNNDDEEQVIVSDNGELLPIAKTKLLFTTELSAVRVLGLYSSDGNSVQTSKDLQLSKGEGKIDQPAQVILDLLPKQQAMMLQAEYGGDIHMVILPKEIQDKYRKLWGLTDKEDIDLSIKGQEDYQKDLEELEKQHYDLDKEVKEEGTTEEQRIEEGENQSQPSENKVDVTEKTDNQPINPEETSIGNTGN